MTGEQKAYMDSVMKQWTNGELSDSDVEDIFLQKIVNEWGLPVMSAGVNGNEKCLFRYTSEIPDLASNLAEMSGAYNFVGLYTKGEYDENGYLKCYYWEAGVI